MAKKKIEIKREYLNEILSDKLNLTYTKAEISRNLEEDVDTKVKICLENIFNDSVVGKKTGVKYIDSNIPPYHGDTGNGKPDIMIYNFFNKNEISMIIENKNFISSDNALDQAKTYAKIGDYIDFPCRIVIGNSPSKPLEVQVLVMDHYEPLIINGKVIDHFFGLPTFKLIYDNPNINEFILEELVEKPFTQIDFHNIINHLKTLYRQIPEIQNNDNTSINFTVSFVALKMIIEKQGLKWSDLKNVDDILAQLNKIVGNMPDVNLREKYLDIFKITDDTDNNNISFDFKAIIDSIRVREYTENNHQDIGAQSVIMKIHSKLSTIPDKDLSIDLFGEVYECLASKKTKSLLGEYFTRRHIIQVIVRMFLTEDDIQNIVEYKKLIADPCCGTGGFLTESFKHIKHYCENNEHDLDISDLASKIIIGYDINNNSIGRTRINMTLAGDGFSDIRKLNTLTCDEIKTDIDYILTNIPYGKGDVSICDPNSCDPFLKSNNNKRLEVNFIIRIIHMLKKNGKAAIIVPEGLLEASSLAPFREYLLKQCKLKIIISLPKFTFAPYTKWNTYVIFIEKRQTPLNSIDDVIRKNEKIWAYIIDNDGYANSDKKFPTSLKASDGSWLHDEVQQYVDSNGVKQSSKIEEAYEECREDEKQSYINEWNQEIKGKKYGYISINDIVQKNTVIYNSINATSINKTLGDEANYHSSTDTLTILSDDNYNTLINNITFNPKTKKYSVKKENYFYNNSLKEDFLSIFEELNIEYDSDNNKFYNLNEQKIVYALPLIPERYFRKENIQTMSLDTLNSKINEIEDKLKKLFGGNLVENF